MKPKAVMRSVMSDGAGCKVAGYLPEGFPVGKRVVVRLASNDRKRSQLIRNLFSCVEIIHKAVSLSDRDRIMEEARAMYERGCERKSTRKDRR